MNNENTMDEKYSWVNTHKEIAQYLKKKEHSQLELIELLKSIGIGPFNDKSKEGEYDIELSEIDPFTFFCFIHKYGEKKRLKLLQQLAKKLGFEVPEGESGIPTAQAQRVWLFPFKFLRVNDEINRLWSFFKKELNGDLNDDDFADVLKIKNVGKVKLTEALFYINPEKYLPINGPTIPYIEIILGIEPVFETYSEYLNLLENIKEKTKLPFYELSFEAWKWNDDRKKKGPIQLMIEKYKTHITENKLQDEVFKWEQVEKYKGRPNLDRDDFYEEIKSISYKHLMYAMSRAVLNRLALEKTEETRQLFVQLFDESRDLSERVKWFNEESLKLYKEIEGEHSHHQDERSMSAYLTYRYPEKYVFYKYNYYANYCKLIGVDEAKNYERYVHYLSLIDDLIEQHIVNDAELIEQVKGYIPQYYDGEDNKLLAQDILFQMLDRNTKTSYWVFQGNPTMFDFKAAMQDDVIESWTVASHKDKIKEGDKVIIWITGERAGCYALADVTSKPYERQTAERDDKYWKEESKNNVVVDIEITHNFMNNPLLKDDIKIEKELANLNVGHQGTNFSATEKQYNAILKMIKQTSNFEDVKNKFDTLYGASLFENFIENLRKIVSELNLQPNDVRIVYSVRNNRFNFIIGQRYCFNIHLSHPDGVYGLISTEKLSELSNPFDGLPKAYYTNFNDFNLTSEEWGSLIETMRKELKRTTKSSYLVNNNKDFENYVFETIPPKNQMNYPLNTIFYGPPGTGKTYNTVLRAAEIIEDGEIKDYKDALEIFNANLHNQIEFITFHQNYSYEDFIQGIRPDTDNNEELTFEKKDGIFKKIADRALKNLKESEKPTVHKKTFEEAFNQFIVPLVQGEVEELEIKMAKLSYYITAVTDKSISFRKASGGTAHTMSIITLGRMYEAESVMGIKGLTSYYAPLLEELLKIGKDLSGKKETVEKKNFVIIIDEINRANISRVFGELITLIEPDKRSHGEIPMQVKLPSGDKFIVPSNLYIIGTMNTADKSIALLDIALRRRFEFEAMYPLYEIEGKVIHDVDILEKMNARIISTKGYDFQIGHSFFMDSKEDAYELKKRMNNKVIPLLLEYYMNEDKEVKGILQSAGLTLDEKPWPLRIQGKNDQSI